MSLWRKRMCNFIDMDIDITNTEFWQGFFGGFCVFAILWLARTIWNLLKRNPCKVKPMEKEFNLTLNHIRLNPNHGDEVIDLIRQTEELEAENLRLNKVYEECVKDSDEMIADLEAENLQLKEAIENYFFGRLAQTEHSKKELLKLITPPAN